MKKIPLSKGLFALVDDADFEYINQWKWCATQCGNKIYAMRKQFNDGVEKNIKMHRQILNITNRRIHVDHKDENGLNNQRINIRQATPSQNAANRGVSKRNATGLKGVSWSKVAKKWLAQIKSNGMHYYLGIHEDAQTARQFYIHASCVLNGEFSACENENIPLKIKNSVEMLILKKQNSV